MIVRQSKYHLNVKGLLVFEGKGVSGIGRYWPAKPLNQKNPRFYFGLQVQLQINQFFWP